MLQVWLADESLLVLKGGSTPDRSGFDSPWSPIDNFQAPYREPVLPPPDFDPDTLDIGVGVPIETLVRERARTRDSQTPPPATPTAPPTTPAPAPPPRPRVTPPPAAADPLQPYKEEVAAGREEFRQFLDDVSQFISDMENFHSVKQQSASKTLVRTLPPPPPSPAPVTVTPAPLPSPAPTPSPAYPISYTSPNARVFLSTNYISHTSTSLPPVSSTLPPARKQVRYI